MAAFNRDQAKKDGGLVSEQPVQRDVAWVNPDGEEIVYTVWVRMISFAEHEPLAATDKTDFQKTLLFVSQVIMWDTEDGPVPMSFDEASRLHRNLAIALQNAALDVNGFGEGKP
jgi:hypothetical protein